MMRPNLPARILCIFLLALNLCLAAESREEGAPIAVHGFLDFVWGFNSTDSTSRGAMINDGAFYLNKEFAQGRGEVTIDLPFKGNVADGNNNFKIAEEQAQAYISFKYANGLYWQAGQFDAVLGFEGSDSVDRAFSYAGIVGGLLEATHTGALIGFGAKSGFGIKLYAANPNNTGSLNGNHTDTGMQLLFEGDGAFRGAIGYATHDDTEASSSRQNSVVDVIMGLTLGSLVVDIELANKKTAGLETRSTGVAGHFGYFLSDNFECNLRFEYLRDAPNEEVTGLVAKQTGVTVGSRVGLSEGLNLRIYYTQLVSKILESDGSDIAHSGGFSISYKF